MRTISDNKYGWYDSPDRQTHCPFPYEYNWVLLRIEPMAQSNFVRLSHYFTKFGGVPSPLETTASICTRASIAIAETPTIVLAGRSPLKNVV